MKPVEVRALRREYLIYVLMVADVVRVGWDGKAWCQVYFTVELWIKVSVESCYSIRIKYVILYFYVKLPNN